MGAPALRPTLSCRNGSMTTASWISLVILCFLTSITRYAAAPRPRASFSSGEASVAWADTLSLCQQLHNALLKALGDKLAILSDLKRHIQLEQYHARQLLELEFQVMGDEFKNKFEAIVAEKLLVHGQQMKLHESFKTAIIAGLQQALLTSGPVADPGSGVDGVEASGLSYSGATAAAVDVRFLPQCMLSRLDTSLYTSEELQQGQHPHPDPNPNPQPHDHGRPLVSLLVQYFNRPWMLPILAEPFRRCAYGDGPTTGDIGDIEDGDGDDGGARGSAGTGSSAREDGVLGFGMEMLVNVDSSADAAVVAEFAAGPLGLDFVVPVYSNNVHEIRSYNRLAQLARGKILIMLQDDDVFPAETTCSWLAAVVRTFKRWPRMGAVGSQRYVFDYHPNSSQDYVHFWDQGAGIASRGGNAGGGGGAASAGARRKLRLSDGDGTEGGGRGTVVGAPRSAAGSDAHPRNGQDEGQQPPGEVRRPNRRQAVRGPRPAAGVLGSRDLRSKQQMVERRQLQEQPQEQQQGHQEKPGEGAGAGGDSGIDASSGGGNDGGGDGADGGAGVVGRSESGTAGADSGVSEADMDPLPSYADDGRLRMQFVSIIDYAPIAVRRSAFLNVGGIDENMSESGMCGVHSDYDFTLRMWLAGWQVSYLEMPGLAKDPHEGEGGTHRAGVSGYCWERQWELAIDYMRSRWGKYCRWEPEAYYWFGSNVFEVVSEHVRLLNLRLLSPLADPAEGYCPFGYGCDEQPHDSSKGVGAPVAPLFGNLSTWPKHRRAPWGGVPSAASRG